MSHLEEGVLHAMLDGEVESAELKGIEAHLAACGVCATRLEEARRFRDEAFAMITALDEQPAVARVVPAPVAAAADRPPRTRGWRRLPAWAPGLAWAATIVAAVGLGWSLQAGEPEAPPTISPGEVVAVAQPSANQALPAAPEVGPEQSRTAERRDRERPAAKAPTETATTSPAPAPAPTARPEVAAEVALAAAAQDEAAGLGDVKADSRLARKSLAAPAPASAEGVAFRALKDGTWAAISAAGAIEALGGSIKLIDGLQPTRYERLGDLIRVGYETPFGPLLLEQWRAANVVSHRLVAPAGAPADSVEAWKERVR